MFQKKNLHVKNFYIWKSWIKRHFSKIFLWSQEKLPFLLNILPTLKYVFCPIEVQKCNYMFPIAIKIVDAYFSLHYLAANIYNWIQFTFHLTAVIKQSHKIFGMHNEQLLRVFQNWLEKMSKHIKYVIILISNNNV